MTHKRILYWLVVGVLLNIGMMYILSVSFIDAAGMTALGMLAGDMGSK